MDNLTLSLAKNRLMDVITKRIDGEKGKINPCYNHRKNHRKKSTNYKNNKSKQFQFQCYNCGLLGHKRSECPKNSRRKLNYMNKTVNKASNVKHRDDVDGNDFCFSATTEEYPKDTIKWLLDSGATEHLVNSAIPLENVKELKNPIKIKVAKSGTFLLANKVGDIEVYSSVNKKEIPITIKGVLSVPGLQYNLLSVRRLEINGYRVSFENGQSLIQKGERIAAIAYRNESQLYSLSFRYKTISAGVCVSAQNFELWHKRLGHINFDNLKKLKKQSM